MSKKTDTWMPLLVDKYLGDTGHLTTEQHGAYLLLLMHAWKKGGLLPNDDAKLATICRLPTAKWRAYSDTLLEFFDRTEDGTCLVQKRLVHELKRAQRNIDQRSEAGKASAAARKAQREGNGRSTNVATEDATQPATGDATDASRNVKPTPTPIGNTSERERAHARAMDVDNPDPPEANGMRPTPGGQVFRAALDAGLEGASPSDAKLHALFAQGATAAEISAVVAEAGTRGKSWAWALAVVEKRRADAAKVSLVTVAAPNTDAAPPVGGHHRAAPPPPMCPAPDDRQTQAYLAAQQQTPEQKAAADEARRKALADMEAKGIKPLKRPAAPAPAEGAQA